MKSPKHLTRQDAVILSLSVLLLMNLAAVGGLGRHRARQAVCLANLRQMTSAWLAYAGDNDGRLIFGEAGIRVGYGNGVWEKPWIGKCWDQWTFDVSPPEAMQIAGIREGALWPYVRETRLYGCPDGFPGHMQTCSIVGSMNGMPKDGTFTSNKGFDRQSVRVGDTVLWVRKLSEIISPGPDRRMVFIDQGWAQPSGFFAHYNYEQWWTVPPVRHWDGTSVTFADGHAEHWRWQGKETILNGRGRGPSQFSANYTLATPEDKEDLHRLQIAVWGRLGY